MNASKAITTTQVNSLHSCSLHSSAVISNSAVASCSAVTSSAVDPSREQWVRLVHALVGGGMEADYAGEDLIFGSASLTERILSDRSLLDQAFSDTFSDSELLQQGR